MKDIFKTRRARRLFRKTEKVIGKTQMVPFLAYLRSQEVTDPALMRFIASGGTKNTGQINKFIMIVTTFS
jgi:hypothetical protein